MALSSRQNNKKGKTRKVLRRPGSEIQIPPPLDHPDNMAGKDFFKYVNGTWLHSVHVPPYISSFGISEEIEVSIESKIERIVQRCRERSKLPLDHSKKSLLDGYEWSIGTVAESALHVSKQQNSIKTLQKLLIGLHCIRDNVDIARTIGELARYKVKGLLWMYGQYENERNTEFTYTLGVGSVGLPDISYYKKTAPGKSRTLFQYANLLKNVGKKLDVPQLSTIVGLESILASSIQKSFSEDKEKITGGELQKKYPDIPFGDLLETFGLEHWKQQVFFVESDNWLQTVQKMFRHLPLETWKLLFASQLVLHFLPFLPPPFDDLHFAFFRKRLRGQAEKIPQKNLTLAVIEDWMTPFISRLYVEEIVEKGLKEKAIEFVEELQFAAEHRLSDVDWLEKKTRSLAQEKVKKMKASIAYPNHFDNLSLPQVQSENLLENILKLGEWRTQYEMKRLGEKRKDQRDWDDPVFAANAYYYPQANEIIVPSGSLYWPFFQKGAPLGWNHGGLGCIVAHEITHAFDKEGKDFDPEGFEKRWWTLSDNRGYNKRTKALVQLFNKQRVLGHPVSGQSA